MKRTCAGRLLGGALLVPVLDNPLSVFAQAEPFDQNAVIRTTVCNATITIIDGNHAKFDYTVNGVAQTKNLTRQVFAAPGTVCQ